MAIKRFSITYFHFDQLLLLSHSLFYLFIILLKLPALSCSLCALTLCCIALSGKLLFPSFLHYDKKTFFKFKFWSPRCSLSPCHSWECFLSSPHPSSLFHSAAVHLCICAFSFKSQVCSLSEIIILCPFLIIFSFCLTIGILSIYLLPKRLTGV